MNTWFEKNGWEPFDFQSEAWAYSERNQLINAPTGFGKTYAALIPAIESEIPTLWLTPLRALANDLQHSIQKAIEGFGKKMSVGVRTGDTSPGEKRNQRKQLPDILVTTPESLNLLISYSDMSSKLRRFGLVVVDEWHELLGTKRGVQVELALARMKKLNPELRIVGLSATIGNLEQAARVLFGQNGRIIKSQCSKNIECETILPKNLGRFPWFGHIGLSVVDDVIEKITPTETTLVFTKTRNQAENWYLALSEKKPEWPIAIHHGSIDRDAREEVEAKIRRGELKVVVCTSSLDLGVDFPPVSHVMQIGSPKGIGRLLQRAGRSGHTPGKTSVLYCVPTNTFELVEFSAARRSLLRVETRDPLVLCLDVLVQHLVTVALGNPFVAQELFEEIRSTHAYSSLSEANWEWLLEFLSSGGHALRAYDQYKKLEERNGRYRVNSRQVARLHRMSIGTITSDAMVQVKYAKGGLLGTVEESFIAKLKPGEAFFFSGKVLKLMQFREGVALVRRAKNTKFAIPKWVGGRLPLSTHLAEAVREEIQKRDTPEMLHILPTMDIQQKWSHLPQASELLVENYSPQYDEHRSVIYPFEGRLVHEGLATLLAERLSREQEVTVTAAVNDYGIELLCTQSIEMNWRELLSSEHLVEDILRALKGSELAKRQFRDIARVSGLVFQGYPGSRKSNRQVQVSSGLLYDVFEKYEPENLLFQQATREVMEQQFELSRLSNALKRMQTRTLVQRRPKRLTPLAFPLWAERMHSQISSESFQSRVERMLQKLEKEARG